MWPHSLMQSVKRNYRWLLMVIMHIMIVWFSLKNIFLLRLNFFRFRSHSSKLEDQCYKAGFGWVVISMALMCNKISPCLLVPSLLSKLANIIQVFNNREIGTRMRKYSAAHQKSNSKNWKLSISCFFSLYHLMVATDNRNTLTLMGPNMTILSHVHKITKLKACFILRTFSP